VEFFLPLLTPVVSKKIKLYSTHRNIALYKDRFEWANVYGARSLNECVPYEFPLTFDFCLYFSPFAVTVFPLLPSSFRRCQGRSPC
jgi:hypothetical protein